MMTDDGMVAVVRGLGGGGLAVTVLDKNNHYTLIPNMTKETPQHLPNNTKESVTVRRDSTVQAEDDRYITTYQTEHCKRRPSSPPVQLSEFPPQRSVLSPGHGNFDVGGTGSQETYPTISRTANFRGGMNWPDRGCVCSPRGSYKANVFANSLRRYPTSRPDRSSEVMERIVNYNIERNESKNQSQSFHLSDSYTMEHRATDRSYFCKADIKNRKTTESPIENWGGFGRQEIFQRDYDLRFLRDLSRRAKVCAKIAKRSYVERSNTESQAAVKMVSREVATAPRPAPDRRTIAIPVSPLCVATEDEHSYLTSFNPSQTVIENKLQGPKLIQTVSSCVDLNKNNCRVNDCRRTRSQESVKKIDEFIENPLKSIPNVSICGKVSYAHPEVIYKPLEYDKKQVKCDTVTNNDICKNACVSTVNHYLRTESYTVNKPLVISECELYYIIKKWLSNISLRGKDVLGRRISRNSILRSAARKIKVLIMDRKFSDDDLKSEILNIIQSMPLKGFCNLKFYKNKLIRILFDNLIRTLDQPHMKINKKHSHYFKKPALSKRKRNAITTESTFKNLIGPILDDFLKKSNVTICKDLVHILKYELVDVMINSVDPLNAANNGNIKEAIRRIFMQCDQVTKEQVDQITDILNDQIKKYLAESNIHNIYPVSQNLITPIYYTKSMSQVNKSDLNINLCDYAHQLIKQIKDWLNNLNIPRIQDSSLKLVVINELASDIIDRQKYLNFNPSKRGSDCTELEYLKYQIFKWINKLVGVETNEALKHAEELMSNIKSLPVPTLTRSQVKLISSKHICDKENTQTDIINYNSNCLIPTIENNMFKKVISTQSIENSATGPNILVSFGDNIAINTVEIENTHKNKSNTPDSQIKPKQHKNINNKDESEAQNFEDNWSCVTSSINALNEDYGCYLKQWIEEIPILVKNSEEEKLAALARLGILHGIWKAIETIKLDPKVYHNPSHFQDVLDDEIESLLQNLPQTKELETNKHKLKVQLLEKTLMMNEQIKALATPASFKQQLLNSLGNNLPKISKFDPLREEEELHKISLIEDYILFIKFKDDEQKSNIYKNSFLTKIENLANNSNRNQRGKDVSREIHVSDLISAVTKVPIPDIKKVNDEANDILLGMEINRWLSNLPLYINIDPVKKRRIIDSLVMKINEIESQKDNLNFSTQVELRKEIRNQLENLSLQVDDVSFIIEELAKRFKYLPKEEIKSKTVTPRQPQDYAEFSKDIPACSSYIDSAVGTNDGRSYMVVGGNIVRNSETNNLPQYSEPTLNEEQWLSMDITKMPPNMLNWSQDKSRVERPNITHTSTLNDHQVSRQVPIVTHSPNDISYVPHPAMPFPFVHGAAVQPGHLFHGQIPYKRPNYVDKPHFYTQPPLSYSQNVLNNEGRQLYNKIRITSHNQYLNQFQDRPQASTAQSTNYGEQYVNEMSNQFNLNPGDSTAMHRAPITPNEYGIPVHSTPAAYNSNSRAIHIPVTTANSPQFLGREDPNMHNRIGETIGNPISSSTPLPAYDMLATASTSQGIRNNVIAPTDGAGTSIIHTSKMAAPTRVAPQAGHEKPSNDANVSDIPVFYRSTEKRGIKRTIKQNKIKHQYDNKNNEDKKTVIPSPLLDPVETAASTSNAPTGYVEFTPASYVNQPFDYLTPQQPIPQIYPERPRKRYQNYHYVQESNDARQRLELEDSDYESEPEEEEIRCRCMRRHPRFKPRFCYPSYDFFNGFQPYFPSAMMPCPYLHFR